MDNLSWEALLTTTFKIKNNEKYLKGILPFPVFST